MQKRLFPSIVCGVVFFSLVPILISRLAQAQQLENPVACDEASEPIPLNYGDHTTGCNIGPEAVDQDQFEFHGTVGDAITITVLSTTNGLDPALELRDPEGTVIKTGGCSGNTCCSLVQCSFSVSAEGAEALPLTGTYTLKVFDSGFNESGGYILQLERIPPVTPPPTIAYNSSISDQLNPGTDKDFFTFEGEAGTDVQITVLSTTNGLDPALELRDPEGTVIKTGGCSGNTCCSLVQCSFSVSVEGAEALPLTGTYLVILQDGGSNESGGYQVNLQCNHGPCPTGQPNISVSPTSFNFGNIEVGFSSDPQPLAITNNGTRNLIIGTIAPNPTPSAFGVVNDNCSGQTLTPLTSCTLDVVFAPTGPGPATPVLTIRSNDPDTPVFDVALTGGGSGETAMGGSVTTATPEVVLCRNLTSGQSVRILSSGRTWNCEAAGLTVETGDEVLTAIRGVAD
jgi:hypothetical protein